MRYFGKRGQLTEEELRGSQQTRQFAEQAAQNGAGLRKAHVSSVWCHGTSEQPSTAAGAPLPGALELLSCQSSGGWMLPSRKAQGFLLGMVQWGKASYAAGDVPVLRNGVAR